MSGVHYIMCTIRTRRGNRHHMEGHLMVEWSHSSEKASPCLLKKAAPRYFTAEHTFPPPFSSRPPSWLQPASAPLNKSTSFVSTLNFKV